MKRLIIYVIAACTAVTLTYAQTPAGLEGRWEGALAAGLNQLRLVLNISKAADDLYLGTLTSLDQGGARIPVDKIQQTGDLVRLEVTVPVAPTPFPAGGKIHLVYELHVTNLAGLELPLSKLEVLNGETTVASFEGADLNSLLARPGAANLTDNRVIGPGMRAIAYLWITLDPGAPVPAALRP